MDDGQTTGSITVTLPEPTLIDVTQIQEYIPLRQRISSFKTEVFTNGEWIDFGNGKTIGYKRLVKGVPRVAEKIRVTITGSLSTPLINNISAFKADDRIAMDQLTIPGKIEAVSCSTLSGAISENKAPNGGGNLGAVKDGSYACYQGVEFKQVPTNFTLCYSGEKTPEITLRLDSTDGPILAQTTVESPGSYNTYITKTVPITYEDEPITGYHNLYLCMNSGLNVDWFELGGVNSLSIAPETVKVYEGESTDLTITRSDEDLSEEVTVQVTTTPDTAVSGQDYEKFSQTLTFAPDETTKTVTIKTMESDLKHFDTQFTVQLSNPSYNAMIGSDGITTITIVDNDGPVGIDELNKAIEKANEKVESDYMPNSWTAFQAVLEEALALKDNLDATQKEVDQMVEKLNQAMNNLKAFQYNEENPLKLSATETIDVGAELMVPVGTARITSRSGDSGGKEVKEMGVTKNGTGELKCVFDVPVAGDYNFHFRYFTGAPNVIYWTNNKEGDQACIGSKELAFTTSGQHFEEDDFTIHFPEAGVQVIRFYNNEKSTCNFDKFSITCLEEFQTANKISLKFYLDKANAVDLSVIESLVESAQAKFTAALENGQKVYDNATATQEEVDAAAKELRIALNMLSMVAGNKDALNDLIKEAENLLANAGTGYSQSVIDELQKAIDAAKEVANDGDAFQRLWTKWWKN